MVRISGFSGNARIAGREPSPLTPVRLRHDGAAAVEFAIVLGLLILILGGIFEVGRALMQYDALAKATRDGARWISRAPPANFSSAFQTISQNGPNNFVLTDAAAAGVQITAANITVTCIPGCSGVTVDPSTWPTYVKVQIAKQITIGEVIPVALFGGPASYSTTVTPSTTMAYIPCTSCVQ